MNQVFMTNVKKNHDVRTIQEYGELIPITEGIVNDFDPDQVKIRIKDTLSEFNFDSEKDYIALAGRNSVNFYVGIVLAELRIRKFRLLLWDAVEENYKVRQMVIEHPK